MRFAHRQPADRRAARLVAMSAHRHESGDSAAAAGIELLTGVITTYGADRLVGRGEARESDRALRAAARRLADEARTADPVRAERLLIALRGAWASLPAVRRLPANGSREALWDRVVRVCVEEFYREARPAAPAPCAGSAVRSA
jgi:hypothetical protein